MLSLGFVSLELIIEGLRRNVRFSREIDSFIVTVQSPAFRSVVGWAFFNCQGSTCTDGSNRLMGPRTEMRQIRPVSLQGGN